MQNSSEGNKNEPKEGTAETQVFIENNEAVIETP